MPHQALFYPKSIYKKYNYNVKYSLFADYQYNMMLFSKYPFKYLNQTIAWFNDAGSCVKYRDVCFDKDKKHIIISFFGIYALLCCYILSFLKRFSKEWLELVYVWLYTMAKSS